MMNFSEYKASELKGSANVLWIDGYKLEYLAFATKEQEGKTPIMFLGGAFQSFSSFRGEVEKVIHDAPVILLDLPSQGSNDQLAPELEMTHFADLIAAFLLQQKVEKIQLMGVSYGSVMASLFAAKYPRMITRLLVSGITCFRRNSLITLLEDSLALLDNGDMEAFAATAVCNLINHNRINQTKISPTYRRLLHRQIARLTDNERLRYAQNTRRLLRFKGFESFPQCETLIATGEYDNFTLPQENAAVARKCTNARLAIIKDADHLAQFEQKAASTQLIHAFFTGVQQEGIAGVEMHTPSTYEQLEKRLQPRFAPLEQPYTLYDKATGKTHTVKIKDINFSGCCIEQINLDMSLTESNDHLHLDIPETGHRYHIRVLSRSKKQLRCIIIQRDMESATDLINYLNEHFLLIRENAPSVEEVAGMLA